MGRNRGTFDFSANFEPLVAGPFDARKVVELYSDLIDPATWEDGDSNVWLYNGMTVAVTADPLFANNGVYWLKDKTDYTNPDAWVHNSDDYSYRETVNRTIYCYTTGSDLTGDGSIGNPFLTINRTLQSIQPTIGSPGVVVTITIQFDAGTFDLTANDKLFLILYNYIAAGTILFKGANLATYLSAISLTEAVVGSGSYNLTHASHTFTEGELRGKFISTSGTKGDPIGWNSAGVNACIIEVPREGRGSYHTIFENATYINNSDNLSNWFTIRPVIADGNINFDFIGFNINVAQNWTPSRVAMQFRRGSIEESDFGSTFLDMHGRFDEADRAQVALKFVEFQLGYLATARRLMGMNNFSDESMVTFARVAFYLEGVLTEPCLQIQKSVGVEFNRVMFCSSLANNSTVGMGFLNFAKVRVRRFMKFVNLRNVVEQTPSVDIDGGGEPTSKIFHFNHSASSVSFFGFKGGEPPGSNFRLTMTEETYFNDPANFSWFYSIVPHRFISPTHAMDIALIGTPAEISSDVVESAIPVNTSTPVIVGDKRYNETIEIDYKLIRGTNLRSGKINILNVNTTSLLISDTLALTNVDPGVTFTATISSNDIVLNVIVDNADANTVKMSYNVKRIMR